MGSPLDRSSSSNRSRFSGFVSSLQYPSPFQELGSQLISPLVKKGRVLFNLRHQIFYKVYNREE